MDKPRIPSRYNLPPTWQHRKREQKSVRVFIYCLLGTGQCLRTGLYVGKFFCEQHADLFENRKPKAAFIPSHNVNRLIFVTWECCVLWLLSHESWNHCTSLRHQATVVCRKDKSIYTVQRSPIFLVALCKRDLRMFAHSWLKICDN